MDPLEISRLQAKAEAELRRVRSEWRALRDAGIVSQERWARVQAMAESDVTATIWHPVDVYQQAIEEVKR